MSARLKLKKLQTQTKFILDNCRRREAEARSEVIRCHRLIRENIIEVGTLVEFFPTDTMRSAVDCLNYNIQKASDAIVRKYTERLSKYVHDKLLSEFMFNRFTTLSVRLLAPALTADHVNVHVTEET